MAMFLRGYFNLFSGTVFEGKHYSCSQAVMVLRGFAKGEPTLSMSRGLKVSCESLLGLRHQMQDLAFSRRDAALLPA